MIMIAVPRRLSDILGPDDEHTAVLELQHQSNRAYMTFARERDVEDAAMAVVYWTLSGLKRLDQAEWIADVVENCGLLDVVAAGASRTLSAVGLERWHLSPEAEHAEDQIAVLIRHVIKVG